MKAEHWLELFSRTEKMAARLYGLSDEEWKAIFDRVVALVGGLPSKDDVLYYEAVTRSSRFLIRKGG